jgi:hypothetical protein
VGDSTTFGEEGRHWWGVARGIRQPGKEDEDARGEIGGGTVMPGGRPHCIHKI